MVHGEKTGLLQMLIFLILLCHFPLNGHCACWRKSLQAEADQYNQSRPRAPLCEETNSLPAPLVFWLSTILMVVIAAMLHYFWLLCLDIRSGRRNASVTPLRLEKVSLPDILPSHEQAVAGPDDVPPPPYPGSRPGSSVMNPHETQPGC